jgi:hypothetical protein
MMTDDEKPHFVAALAELASLKPAAKLTALQYAAWWSAMRTTWTLQAFREACAHLASAVEFMPSPFHFEQLRKASEETAAEVWPRVLAFVRSGEYRYGAQLEGRAHRAVIAMGGYDALGMAETKDTHFREKRFAEIWEELGDVENARAALPHLADVAPPDQRRVAGPQRFAQLLTRADP